MVVKTAPVVPGEKNCAAFPQGRLTHDRIDDRGHVLFTMFHVAILVAEHHRSLVPKVQPVSRCKDAAKPPAIPFPTVSHSPLLKTALSFRSSSTSLHCASVIPGIKTFYFPGYCQKKTAIRNPPHPGKTEPAAFKENTPEGNSTGNAAA